MAKQKLPTRWIQVTCSYGSARLPDGTAAELRKARRVVGPFAVVDSLDSYAGRYSLIHIPTGLTGAQHDRIAPLVELASALEFRWPDLWRTRVFDVTNPRYREALEYAREWNLVAR